MSVGIYRSRRRQARRSVAAMLDRLAADYEAFAEREALKREAIGDTPNPARDDYRLA